MSIELYSYQVDAIDKLRSGSILVGGVGSGKSRTALAYYYIKECGGRLKINGKGETKELKKPKDLYIITTARKRDTLEWEKEAAPFMITNKRNCSISNIKMTIDSWNNIKKYSDIKNSFFIFDEQRVVGYGTWSKTFIKISKSNNWILLSATPGDTWSDYIPVFVANGFYKNKTEFVRRHAVFNRFTKYPKIDHYIETDRLIKLRNKITVQMDYKRKINKDNKTIFLSYDKDKFNEVVKNRWNPYDNEPIKDISQLCYTMRRVVNSDLSRLDMVKNILKEHDRVIVFYNFNYELEILRTLKDICTVREWNGHKHEKIPNKKKWVYLVQYTAGAEGWNCIDTNCIVFYSQNYSYKIMIQAAGRIDRLNTPYQTLYYYHLTSKSQIDLAIKKALDNKKDFNENNFYKNKFA